MIKEFSFWKKFTKYLFIGLSAMSILAAVVSIKPENFLKVGPEKVFAVVDGLHVDPPAGSYTTNMTFTVGVDEGSRFANQSVTADIGVFHCNSANGANCSTGDGDYIDGGIVGQETFTAPGEPGTKVYFTRNIPSYSCGRVQVDVGISEGILGGTVYNVGSDCSSPPPPPPPPPVPIPSSPPPPPPCDVAGQPSGFNYNSGNKTLSWNAGSNASFYNVRLVSPNGTQYNHDNVSNVWFTFPDSEVSAFGNYTGWVDAVNNCGTSSGSYSFTINSPPPPPPVPIPITNITCSASPATANIGDTITWRAENVVGGVAPYRYSWVGAASGDSQTVSASYSTSGTKTASVDVVDSAGNNLRSQNCTVVINANVPPPVDSCTLTANPSTINSGEATTLSVQRTGSRIPIRYSFTFGDGSVQDSNSSSITHVYTSSNNQNFGTSVQLFDSLGLISSCSGAVSVLASVNNASIVITKTTSTPSIDTGAQAIFTINLHNTSGRDLINISTTDTLPNGFSYVFGSTTGSTTTDPTISGNNLTWSNISMPNNGDWSITFRVSSSSSGTFNNIANVSVEGRTFNPSQATVIVGAQIPSCTLTTNPSTINSGSSTLISTQYQSNGSNRTPTSYIFAFGDSTSSQTSNINSILHTYNIVGSNNQSFAPSVQLLDGSGLIATCIGSVTVLGSQLGNPNIAITKTTTTPVITSGQQAVFTVNLHNNSGRDLSNVRLTDTLPGGFTYLAGSTTGSTTNDPVISDNNLTWSNIFIGNNADWNITFRTNTSAPAGTYVNSALANVENTNFGPATASVVINEIGGASIAIVKLPASQTINLGAQATFTVNITNNSGRALSSVSVFDDLPTGFSYVAGSTTGSTTANPTISGNRLTWSSISLANTQQWNITFKATAASSGTYINSALANAENTNFGPAQVTVIVNAQGAPVLTIQKTPSSQTIIQGAQGTFTLTVINNSGRIVSGISVFDDLPNGFTYVLGSSTGSTTTDPVVSGNVLTWTGITLANTQQWNVSFKATSNTPGTFTNQGRASAESTNFGPSTVNIVVTGTGVPVLTVEKTPATQNANPGAQATFTIKIHNGSGRSVSNISVFDDLPAGFSYVSSSTTGSTTTNPTVSGNRLTWTGITLANAQDWTISFKATAPQTPGTYTNSALASAENTTFGPSQAVVIVPAPAAAIVPAGGVAPVVPAPIVINNPPQIINNTIIRNVGVGTSTYTSTVLPKTGMSEAIWGSLAFLPIGLFMARFKKQKEILTGFAKSVFESRMFNIKYPAE